MYVKPTETVKEINFLKSAKFVSFTYQADAGMSGVVNGVLPAGSIYPANDATAIGITINDVDVSNGSQPVGVIVEGYILKERLPVAPANDAAEAMKEIKLV